jgi:DNA-binding transcriptional LysR family regulator
MPTVLEPDLLRTFVAIADTGSFTAAGTRVHRTQSAVSMQIKRLEELVGRSLLERHARSVRLSKEGEQLLWHARRILQAHREALAVFDAVEIEGEITVGAPDDYASTFLPRVLADFAMAHPKAHVTVDCRSSEELVRAAAEGEVDLALVTQGYGDTGGTFVHREPLVWVGSGRHDVHEQRPLPLAMFSPGCHFRRYALEGLARAGIPSRVAYTSISIAGVLAAIAAGLAVGVLMRGTVPPHLRIVGRTEGLPDLPDAGIVVVRGSRERPAIFRLEAEIVEHFRAGRPLSAAA